MVDVVQERVDGAYPLLDPPHQGAPFLSADDAGDDVEGDEPLLRLVLAVHVERDAGPAEERFGLAGLLEEPSRVLGVEPGAVALVGQACAIAVSHHFVEMTGPRLHPRKRIHQTASRPSAKRVVHNGAMSVVARWANPSWSGSQDR